MSGADEGGPHDVLGIFQQGLMQESICNVSGETTPVCLSETTHQVEEIYGGFD